MTVEITKFLRRRLEGLDSGPMIVKVIPVAACGVGRRSVRSNGDPSLPVRTKRRHCRAGGEPAGRRALRWGSALHIFDGLVLDHRLRRRSLCSLARFPVPPRRGVERQQLKWFAFAAVLFVGTNVSQFFYEPPYTWDAFVESVTIVGLYVAIGIAILKYRLYDIDRIINLTLVYGLLTAILAGVYFGGVTATQALFRTLTGQEQLPQLVVVASTLVIAALFNPLRRRIQSFIDRRFYRRKYDAAKTLEGFSLKLRDETDLDALRDDVVGVLGETMQPAHVSLWLRSETAPKGQQTD
jgi:hypothetical protein